MKHASYITLYSAVVMLSVNGLFSNGISLDAASMTHIRSIFAGITLAIFIGLGSSYFRLSSLRTTITVYGIGILMGAHWLTFFYGMQSASVSIGMLALYTFPVMTVIIEPFFNGRKIQKLDIGLTIIVFIGLAIIVSGSLFDGSIDRNQEQIIYGVASGVISALLFSFRNLLQKYHCKDIPSDTLMLHQVIMIVVMMSFLIDIPAIKALSNIDWIYLAILGVFTTAIAHTLLVKSYKLFPAKSVAMISCLQPVFGSILAWLVLGEHLGITTIIGGSIILAVALYESTRSHTS